MSMSNVNIYNSLLAVLKTVPLATLRQVLESGNQQTRIGNSKDKFFFPILPPTQRKTQFSEIIQSRQKRVV